MKIELIVDKNCLSLNSYIEIINKLVQDFPDHKIEMISFERERQRLKDLKINLLPAWLVNDEVVRINPAEYEQIKNHILMRVE